MKILLLRDRRRLPDELWGEIIHLLDFEALCSASRVCKIWNLMATPLKAPRLFKYVHENGINISPSDVVKFPKLASARLAFATLSNPTAASPHAALYFPRIDHTFHWPLPAPLAGIHSSKGFFCGLVSPAVSGQGFQFIVTSEPVSSSTSWVWTPVPPTEFLRYAGADHLPRRVKFVSIGGAFYIVVVADEKAEVIEVFSSKQNAWKRHLRPSSYKLSWSGFKGHIPIAVVEDEKNSLLALSFNPESSTWGGRVPLIQPPDVDYEVLPPQMLHKYEYFGYGENMLAATFASPEPANNTCTTAVIVAEFRNQVSGSEEYRLKEYYFPRDASGCHLINVSTSGDTVCYQWFNGAVNLQSSFYHLNKYGPRLVTDCQILNYGSGFKRMLNTTDKVFLLTCCE